MFFFFFSSGRRHTRVSRDWSSDVCSSDLARRGVGRVRITDEGGESRWREGALLEDATSARKELGIVATLRTPEKLRELQRALYLRAKKEPSFRAYALYDKVYRQDVLTHAFALCKANGGAPG